MSTTTQILFNSPALHALKRDQLVKLCKIHSIKASGKNVDLIDRLKHHAQSLPKDSPLSVALRSENIDLVSKDNNDNILADPDEPIQDNDTQDVGAAEWKYHIHRPSEQWDVVMESIAEAEESSSQGTLSSARTLASTGEFGTGNTKSTTVSSSIRALANSLGLKRITSTSINSNRSASTAHSSASSRASKHLNTFPHLSPVQDELTQHSKPYAILPPADPDALPQTDHFTFDPNDPSAQLNLSRLISEDSHNSGIPHAFKLSGDSTPLPGHALRPGLPAPVNARLSLGLGPSTPTSKKSGPTTTIRLISNPIFPTTDKPNEPATPQLKPFETTFDLVLGSPGGVFAGRLFPQEDGMNQQVYPALPLDTDGDADDMPGAMPSTPPCTPAPSSTLVPTPSPFIFGSPLPEHNLSNAQFRSAAASVLEEMNRRLRDDGVEGVEMNLLTQRAQGWVSGGEERVLKPLPGHKDEHGVREKFEKAHEEEFKKMESIAKFVSRRDAGGRFGDGDALRVGKKRKSSVLGRDSVGPRRPSGMGMRSVAGTRVISNGRRKKATIPGAFGDEEEDEEEARGGKRVRVDDDGENTDTTKEIKKDVDEEKTQKEREAIRRKLDMNKARRRSSMGVARASLGGKAVLHKPKQSRFGFLSSAKSIVQNVWNRGKAAPPAPAAVSSIPVSKPLAPKNPPFQPAKKVSTLAPSRPSVSAAGGKSSRVSSTALNKDKEKDKRGLTFATPSSRAKSPSPSLTGASASSILANKGGSRVSNTMGTNTRINNRNSFMPSSASSSSSIGTRSSVATRSSAGLGFESGSRVSSLGTRSSVGRGGADMGSTGSKKVVGTGGGERKRVLSSSRLLAPTASSLAKGVLGIRASSSTGLSAVAEDRPVGEIHPPATSEVKKSVPALGQITNNLAVTGGPVESRPGRIFSQPLGLPSSPLSTSATNETSMSLGAAGAVLAYSGLDENKESTAPTSASAVLQPKQKVLGGRKPRISRSKVISKLASRRAGTNGGGVVSMAGGSGTGGGGKTRSSLGAKAQRQSYGGGKAVGRSGDVVMSAKRRARQSEYMRRKSRAVGGSSIRTGAVVGMDVDD